MILQPLSPAAMHSIIDSTARINIWTGAVRSGKTIASLIRWIEYAAAAPPGPLMMVGKTLTTLRRNVLDVLIDLIGSDYCSVSMGLAEASIIGRQVYLVGANDERAEGKIRGVTLAGAYGDEISLWPENFFRMLLSRLSVPGAKLFATTNPDSPYHWVKTQYIDRADELDVHIYKFDLDDNLSLDPKYAAAIKNEYTGVWYSRYVLGEWTAAEGLIYDQFDQDNIVDAVPQIKQHYIGIDYGTANPTVYLLVGISVDDKIYVIDEWRYDSSRTGRQMTDAEYSAAYKDWIKTHNIHPRWIFIDPSAASFIAQLRADGVRNLAQADNTVLSGIRRISSLFASNRLFVHKRCTGLINELRSYSWDSRAAQRGEDVPLKTNDHGPDALRYVINGIPLHM